MNRSAPLLPDLLDQTVARHPGRIALIFKGESISWRDYRDRVDNVAKGLLAMGIGMGDRIGVMAPNCPEYLYTYLAAARIGAITVGFNPLYSLREVANLAVATRPSVLVVADLGQRWPHLKQAMCALTPNPLFVTIGRSHQKGVASFRHLAQSDWQDQSANLSRRRTQVSEKDGVLIVPTGGSNGRPKGALLTHANIVANISAQVDHLGFDQRDRLLLHLPLSHVSGATILAIPPLMTGATLIVHERFHPYATLRAVADSGITVLGQVPTMYIMEFGHREFPAVDLSALRMVIVSGAPTAPEVMVRIDQMAPSAVHGYGLTEAGGFVTFTDPDADQALTSGDVGRPMPNVELQIVDEIRQPGPDGMVGEIAVRGPMVMREYYGEPGQTAEAIDGNGWLYTGDLGLIDERQNLQLAGLKKEMFFTGGYNVYPWEIEGYACKCPGVAMAACVPVAHAVLGQTGVLFVVPLPGEEVTSHQVWAHCKAGLAKYKLPTRIVLCDELPLTGAGKVDKAKLSRLAERSV